MGWKHTEESKVRKRKGSAERWMGWDGVYEELSATGRGEAGRVEREGEGETKREGERGIEGQADRCRDEERDDR